MAMSVVYTNFCGMIVSETRGGVERDYVPDTLGSTAALVDETQTITDRWEYWPYGEVSQRSGASGTPFTFVGTLGYFKDVLDKTFYVAARYLDVLRSRWLTVDPLWPQEPAYSYALVNPVTNVDPTGQACLTIDRHFGRRNRSHVIIKRCIVFCGTKGLCLPPPLGIIGIESLTILYLAPEDTNWMSTAGGLACVTACARYCKYEGRCTTLCSLICGIGIIWLQACQKPDNSCCITYKERCGIPELPACCSGFK